MTELQTLKEAAAGRVNDIITLDTLLQDDLKRMVNLNRPLHSSLLHIYRQAPYYLEAGGTIEGVLENIRKKCAGI